MKHDRSLIYRHAAQVTGCFAAGTLVHTRQGLKAIESISAGEWVLSKPESIGPQSYKRVLRNTPRDDRSICQLYCYVMKGDQCVEQEVLLTRDQLVFVAGYHNNGGFSDEYFEELSKPKGWQRAELMQRHQLIELASGEAMHVGFLNPIWRTRDPDRGWIAINPDSSRGQCVQILHGQSTKSGPRTAVADFTGVEDFDVRHETPELQEAWGYRCTVYDLAIEDHPTYYVGEHGIRVRGSFDLAQENRSVP